MNAEEAIRLMDEGMTLVSYKDGIRINKNADSKYMIISANADAMILFNLYKADKNQIWSDDYAIRVSTLNLMVLPEDDE